MPLRWICCIEARAASRTRRHAASCARCVTSTLTPKQIPTNCEECFNSSPQRRAKNKTSQQVLIHMGRRRTVAGKRRLRLNDRCAFVAFPFPRHFLAAHPPTLLLTHPFRTYNRTTHLSPRTHRRPRTLAPIESRWQLWRGAYDHSEYRPPVEPLAQGSLDGALEPDNSERHDVAVSSLKRSSTTSQLPPHHHRRGLMNTHTRNDY